MKKVIIILSIVGAATLSFVLLQRPTPNKTELTIGILQTASHPALDAAREGFEQELRAALGDRVQFVTRNAQGNITNAHTIAQSFHANPDIKGIFAIATPAAQAIATIEKEKPIFIAAVTDPAAAGLLGPTTNVCGSSDMVDPATIVDLIAQLVPKAQTVGLLFNNAEMNSTVQIAGLKEALQQRGLIPLEFGFTSESDVPAAVTSACQKVDALIVPNDNVLSSAIGLVAAIALKNKKPLIASDNLLVGHGVLAARGVDYKASGAQAAQCATQVLVNGKKPYELPIEKPVLGAIIMNSTTAQQLMVDVPPLLKNQITLVE